ncbi:hypothetical protein AX17_005494 [Amanita inopinata Kibby_2008]|nr:hypothetical protein AX17_005494 [Amanita inopinata Kibby_2008]
MESLNTLASSLPTAHQNAEKELLNNFKAAALSLTTLYRSSRETSKRAYDAGYAAACQDLLNMIQQGVSASGIDNTDSREGMTIGRVMDWTEARLEAIKQKEDEEEEEEEREKDRGRSKTTTAPAAPVPPASAPKVTKSPPPNISSSQTKSTPPPSGSSPPPQPNPDPSSSPLILPSAPARPAQRATRPRPSTKGDGSSPYVGLPSAHVFDFFAEPRPNVTPLSSTTFPEGTTLSVSAGAKRRHAMMMMLDAASPSVSLAGSSGPPSSAIHMSNLATGNGLSSGPALGRRRTRSRVHSQQQQIQNQNLNLLQVEAMDVEEEGGRERKRIARR